MKLKHDEQGFAHLVVVGILVVVIVAGTGFMVYRRQQNNKTTISKTTESKSECAANQKLQLCVDVITHTVSFTDSVKLQVTITNKAADSHTETFSSTCIDPHFKINDQLVSTREVCGQAITPVVVEPEKSVKYTIALSGASLREGANQVQVIWGEAESTKMTFTRPKISESDLDKSQQCNEGDIEPYCAGLSVILKDGTYNDTSTCREVEKYFKSLAIHLQYSHCTTARYGIVYFIVPKTEAQMWKDKLSAIPEVKSATIFKE